MSFERSYKFSLAEVSELKRCVSLLLEWTTNQQADPKYFDMDPGVLEFRCERLRLLLKHLNDDYN